MAQSSETAARARRKRIMATPAFLYACVMVMGAVGASLRYLLENLLPGSPLPFSTLCINLFGCYIIYVIYQWFGRRVHLPHAVVRGLGVGLVGAFTTLSAFSTECLSFLQNGAFGLFALYLTLTFAGTFAASLLGWATVSALERRRMRRLTEEHEQNIRRVEDRRAPHGGDRGGAA
ncbi:MAG: fluoride efflux transporter FluC [Eggerthellaceae bacterium]